MDCNECQAQMQRVADHEADDKSAAAVREHLRGCPGCERSFENLENLRAALRNPALRYAAPAGLKQRAAAAAARRPLWPALALCAAALVLATVGVGLPYLWSQSDQRALAQELVSAHVRSLMAAHLSDVLSTDQHTVKPWFAGKLDFSPEVANYPEQKFDLFGGRLDYIARHPAAALIYKRRQHIINLFEWPQDGADDDRGSAPSTLQGYNVLGWRHNGMACWMISDLNLKEMDEFKALLQNRTP